MSDKAKRHTDLDRNLILNRASTDLENIINGHDPEIHNLGSRVWDRLDDLAVSIEVRSDARVSALNASLHECLAWVQHWQVDVEHNLKPTPESLAMVEAKIMAELGEVE